MAKLFPVCIALVLGFFSSTLAQAGVYKIVDENGNVTFSQFPPKKRQESASVEKVEVENDGATRITSVGRQKFCGDITLPDIDPTREEEDLLRIPRKQKYWQEELDRISSVKRVSSNLRYSNNSNKQRSNQRSRDLRCAIGWARSLRGEIATATTTSKQELDGYEKALVQLKADLERSCGTEPAYDPSESAKSKSKEWRKCARPYLSKINRLDSEIRSKISDLR